MNYIGIMTAALTLTTLVSSTSISAAPLETRNLSFNGISFTVEVAEELQDIMIGLSNRSHLAEGQGMLLVYPPNMDEQCVWMKDVLIPLSAAFINSDGVILNVEDNMQPGSEKYHCAEGRAAYVIEMNSGWFSKNRVTSGNRLTQKIVM